MGNREGADWIRRLADEVPALKTILREHVAENREILPYPFVGEVFSITLRWCQTGREDQLGAARAVIEALDRAYATEEEGVRSMIELSFLMGLEGDEPGYRELRALIGDRFEGRFLEDDE